MAELGCGFALDDFGAGFGSFYYLKHLPFDVLKIDGEFVHNLGKSVKDQLVVQSLAQDRDRARQEDRRRVRRGRRHARAVRSYGVDYAQGYGIGRPQPVSEWLGLEPAARRPAVGAS